MLQQLAGQTQVGGRIGPAFALPAHAMARLLRFIPDGGSLVEVTTRTIQSRFLLTPFPELNRIVIGALARASRRYKVGVVAYAFLSNHYHLLAWAEDADQLSRFMGLFNSKLAGLFNSKLAREVARLTGWKDKIWSRRYQEYLARRRGENFGTYQYATRETLELAPLPCWKHLTPERRQQMAAAMASEIEAEAAARRESTGVQALGPAAILAQSPESCPLKTKRSPAPAVHAASRAVRRELRNAYFLFVAAYRPAAEKLKAGQRDPTFPMGCFPPPLPFVGG